MSCTQTRAHHLFRGETARLPFTHAESSSDSGSSSGSTSTSRTSSDTDTVGKLQSHKMAVKTVILGGKNKSPDGSLSQKVTTSYRKWYDRLVLAVRLAMPTDSPYTVVHSESLVGLFTLVMVKNTERIKLNHAEITTVKRGMHGRYGNKVRTP